MNIQLLIKVVNQGVILTHLYGLIVFPKEIFNDKIPNKKLRYVNKKKWGNYEFISLSKKPIKLYSKKEIINDENELTLEFLIRKIRNSLSHGNFIICENMDFIFSDEDGTKVKFSNFGICQFIQAFTKCYIG